MCLPVQQRIKLAHAQRKNGSVSEQWTATSPCLNCFIHSAASLGDQSIMHCRNPQKEPPRKPRRASMDNPCGLPSSGPLCSGCVDGVSTLMSVHINSGRSALNSDRAFCRVQSAGLWYPANLDIALIFNFNYPHVLLQTTTSISELGGKRLRRCTFKRTRYDNDPFEQ